MLYVDSMKIPFRRMLMSHMIADTPAELAQAEKDLGLPKGSVQYPGTWKEHLDISQSKREEAIQSGAKVIPAKELVRILIERRESQRMPTSPRAR